MMRPDATTNPLHRLIILAVISLCGALNAVTALWGLFKHPALNTDFMAFWSFPRFAQTQNILQIYDAGKLAAFQAQLYPGFHSFYPLLYPPTLLLPTWWLGAFSFAAAQTIWTAAGLVLLTTAGWCFFQPPFRWMAIAAMLACPASLLTGATGETAYFTTALLLFGFAALPARPTLAGLAFGLLTLKPQLGVLVPFALLARGEWRAIITAGITASGMVLLSLAVFPPSLWLAWAHSLPVYQAQYFAAGKALNLNIIVTIASNLIASGVSKEAAWLIQCLAGILAAAAIFFAFRRAPYRLAVAALFTGMFLSVPHAYAYDTIPLAAALVLLAETAPLSWPLVLLGLVIYLGPLMLLTTAHHWFLYALPEALLFLTIIRLAFATEIKESALHEPESRLPAN